MADQEKKTFNITEMRNKVKEKRNVDMDVEKLYQHNFSWKAVSQKAQENKPSHPQNPPKNVAYSQDRKISMPQDSQTSSGFSADFNFSGKVLRGGKYSGEVIKNANFSASDLREVDFSKADLSGADFSGADLSGADLSGANLSGAVFSGARLRGTNFTGAKLSGIKLIDADIQDAILLDVDIDELSLQELQDLIEYLAVNFPHKLNLRRINLTMLDLSRIDLSRVSLRGVDFTGVDFTGVNIFDLDLSECIITPEQIAQALGRIPTPLELRKILAPKSKKPAFKGIDFMAFFRSGGNFGTLDLRNHPGITIAKLLENGKSLYRAVVKKPEASDEKILEDFQQKADEKQEAAAKEHNAEMRRIIEQRKAAVLQTSIENPQFAERNKTMASQTNTENKELIEEQKQRYFEQKRQQNEVVEQKIKQMMLEQGRNGGRERS